MFTFTNLGSHHPGARPSSAPGGYRHRTVAALRARRYAYQLDLRDPKGIDNQMRQRS